MKGIVLHTDHAHVPDTVVRNLEQTLQPHVQEMASFSRESYDTQYAFLTAPFDMSMHAHVKKVIATKKALKPSMLIVIGIGGSNLGTIAILQALRGRLHNALHDVQIFFADTIDTDHIQDVVALAERTLHAGNIVLLNVVTKSGTTTETIANFTIFTELLRSFYPRDYQKYIVVTTDDGSPLHHCAIERDMTILTIPEQIGGRYSVFSPVGLFPLGIAGIDIDALVMGAQTAIQENLVGTSNAIRSASIRYYLYSKGININDLFLFSVDFESIGKWYRQLMGESIGKEYNIHGNVVEVGITPTVSLGTTDLHSIGQLYLGGPRDKLTMFVDVQTTKTHCYIPTKKECAIDKDMYGKSMSSLMHAILMGVFRAYEKTNRPYMHLVVEEKSERCIGELLQYMMIEMVYLGRLLEVNPFDQPNVEVYKHETRKILRHE